MKAASVPKEFVSLYPCKRLCQKGVDRIVRKLLIRCIPVIQMFVCKSTGFLHPLYGVDDIRFESLPPPEIAVLFAAAFTERLATVDAHREGATRVRQGESRLFHLNAACLVGFAIPE